MIKWNLTIGVLFSAASLCAQNLPHSDTTAIRLKSVEIKGNKPAAPATTTITTLSGTALDHTKGTTLAHAIQEIPGVAMLQTGATIAKPVIHGLHSNRVLILNNGIPQEGQQWGSEHAPEIDPFIAKKISVIKGAEAVRYGAAAIGGVIIIEPPALPATADIHGEINLAGISNSRAGILSGMLDGGIKKWPGFGWRIQGTLKKAGNIKTADYYLNNTGVREHNYSAAAGYNGAKAGTEIFFSHFNSGIGIFRGAHIGSIKDLYERFKNGRPFEEGSFSYEINAPRQQLYHQLLKVKSYLQLHPSHRLQLQYGWQRNSRKEYDIRRAGRTSLPALDLLLTTHTLDITLESNYRKGWKTILGGNALSQVNNSIPGTYATPIIPNYDTYGAGVYMIVRQVKEKYELEAGVRYDYKYLDALGYDKNENLYGGTHQFNNVSGSLGALWIIHPNLQLRSNLGSAWRPPAVSELYSNGLHHGAAAVERGNKNMKNEQGYKWVNTLEYNTAALSISWNGYMHYIRNYIYLHPAMDTLESLRGAFPVFDYQQTDARFLGMDLLAKYRINTSFTYELKGAIVKAKDISRQQYLPWIPTDRLENTLRWNIPGSEKIKDAYLQVQAVLEATQPRYTPGSDYVAPPEGYHLFNLGTGTKYLLGKNILSIHFSIENVGNVLYKSYMNRFRYYAHDTGRSYALRTTYRF